MIGRFVLQPLVTRILVGLVTLINLDAAVLFIFHPTDYTAAYSLSGRSGEFIIQGFGILFLMWTIPSLFLITMKIVPVFLFIIILAMQAVGVVGESILLAASPAISDPLRSSINRFILFDGLGLLILAFAYWLLSRSKENVKK